MGTAAQLRKAPSPYSERNTLLPRRAVTSSQNRAYRPAVSVRPTPSWKSQSTKPFGSVTTTRVTPRLPRSSSTVRVAPSAVRASGPVARAEASTEAWLSMEACLDW